MASTTKFEVAPKKRELPIVLVVDDDVYAAHAIAEALRDERFVVAVAANGERALDSLAAGLRPSIVLVDRNMPVIDGAAFISFVRADEELAALPIVLMTSFGDTVDRDLAERVQAVLHKPLRLNELIDVIERHRLRSVEEIRLPR